MIASNAQNLLMFAPTYRDHAEFSRCKIAKTENPRLTKAGGTSNLASMKSGNLQVLRRRLAAIFHEVILDRLIFIEG